LTVALGAYSIVGRFPGRSVPIPNQLRARCVKAQRGAFESIAVGLPFARPPGRRRIARRDFRSAQRDQVAALVGVAAELGAVAAPRVPLEFVDGRRLRPPHDVKRDGLVGLAAEAPHLEEAVSGIERVAQRRRRLRRAAHALIPGFASELVGILPSRRGPLGCGADRDAVDPVARFGAHAGRECAALSVDRKPLGLEVVT